MSSKRFKPRWWQLYVGLPLLCSLFVFEIGLHLSETDDTVLQLGILCLIFLFLQAWLRANRGGLMEMDEDAPERQGEWRVRVYQVGPAATITKSAEAAQPLIRLPEGELKGMLSTTFELDAEEPESVFRPRLEKPSSEPALPLDDLRSPAHKE